MTNTENINVVPNKEVIDAVVEAAEAIPVKASKKLGVIGGVVLVGGLIITGVTFVARRIKKKKAAEEYAADNCVDNVQVVKDDFEEKDSAEE